MGFLNSLFGCAPTKYDAQKYFDYAEKQKAKGNIVEALNYYAKVINHGDLGVKPFVPYIELCMEHDEWEKLPACIKVYRKRFPKENSGWIDKIEKKTIEQLRRFFSCWHIWQHDGQTSTNPPHHLSWACHPKTNRHHPNTWEW